MAQKSLDCIEIETGDSVEYSVIWLHGLGASGHDFEPLIPELHLLKRPGVRFVFPHAPIRPITINNGAAMRGWFDITSLNFEQREVDKEGIQQSSEAVMELIANEISRGIRVENIVLAGFSQGGAIALQTAITCEHQVGGVIALSTYLPNAEILSTMDESRRSLDVFMAHGTQDDVIRILFAERSLEALRTAGIEPEWHTYEMSHSVSGEEVADLEIWLKRKFGM
ncbi:MAG: alpha/beta fold hydrolase [Gammaproteobacteria bacterium]|nr:alpha/beta fold hydrolase [Gammaproteobacteria bacterium]